MSETSMRSVVTEDIKWLVEKYSVPWDRLRGKTVLITGASGFLAAYMVETLMYLNEVYGFGITVIALVRNLGRYEVRFRDFIGRPELICIEQDIRDPVVPDRHVDFIIHAASQASPKYYSTDPVGTLSANIFGLAHLLDLARQTKVEGLLYFSSGEVYGETTHVPTSEANYGYLDPLSVRSCYAESKRMGENMCVSWHHQFGVPARIVRPFHTYGPGMRLDDGRVYADFVADIVHGRDIILKSDGQAQRAFCYLADATAGFWMVLLGGEDAMAYNIGNPDGVMSIRELAQTVAGLYPEKGIKVKFQQREHKESYLQSKIQVNCPDISEAMELGWLPFTSIEAGFRKTINSY